MKKLAPIIYESGYTSEKLDETIIKETDKKYILDYPTVYIVNDEDKDLKYSVYVGETSDIKRRTNEHIEADVKDRPDWEQMVNSDTSKMYIIGHHHFNKSLTLDIENKLMQYLSSVDVVKSVNNRRTNQQNEYYSSDEMNEIFSDIWHKLRRYNQDLFPLESVIRDSALFKASPFHKLSNEQLKAREKIIDKVRMVLERKLNDGQLIIVEGEAGSGKTVLMSSLFYELNQLSQDESTDLTIRGTNQYLLVNHDQQLIVYEEIAKRLNIKSKSNPDLVSKPTKFINSHSNENKADVVIVDEAHLLWTQGKQAYRGKNQLDDLLQRARVVVAVFDSKQILSREQFWEKEKLKQVFSEAKRKENYVELKDQFRIKANSQTIDWIRRLIDSGTVSNIPIDKDYKIKIFSSPSNLQKEITVKSTNTDSGISRVTATFDWEYHKKRKKGKIYYVSVGNWKMPWNLQIIPDNQQKRKNKDLAWAEQPQTIEEVGSTFTIQGFDLNYTGVIIGPSVKYRNGKIIFDKTKSKNKKATQYRSLEDGSMYDASSQLLRNELNVLLTRGVHGLYLFAVDPQLQDILLKAQKGELKNEK